MERQPTPFTLLVHDKNNQRIADFLEVNYIDNKELGDINLKTAELSKKEIIPYISKNPNKIGIIDELEFMDIDNKTKQDIQFICAPQKIVLFFLLQYYQSTDYKNKKESILEENINVSESMEGFDNDENNDYKSGKNIIIDKLNRIARMDIQSVAEYVYIDQKSRSDKGDNTPFIIAVDKESTLSFKLFKQVADAYKWNIREYMNRSLTESPENYDINSIYYHIMDFDEARTEFVRGVSRLDCMFYMRDERDWKVNDLFVKYFITNKKSPTILEFKKDQRDKNRKLQFKNVFTHMIDTSLYYTNNSVGGDEGKEDESLAIRLPTLATRNLIICNKQTSEKVVLLLTAICIQNYTYLQNYIYPGCRDGELQTANVKKMNELETKINELSLKIIKNIDNKDLYYDEATLLEESITELQNKHTEYIEIGKICQHRIPVNPFPNFDEVTFNFPSQIVHPIAKEYFHKNGLYSRNPRFKYDLQYYVDKVQEFYWR